jgi:four helix bundle protein
MRDYTKIDAWRIADDLTVAIYSLSRSFPREELYGLTSQLRRASYSVPSNIAEGSSRESKRDYLHFLYIARGSMTEAQYFVHLACRLGYIEQTAKDELAVHFKQAFACLHGLIKAVAKESGKLAKFAATATSLFVICVARLAGGPSLQHVPFSS